MLQSLTWLPRTEGSARLAFVDREGHGALDVLHQAGATRVRFPKVERGAPLEAVLINTAGGLTGGDRIDIGVSVGEGAVVTITTAAAEKIYRAREGEARVRVKLDVMAGARLSWLSQPTILFDGSRFERIMEISVAEQATFLGVETLIFGRAAMQEEVIAGYVRDAWRIRRAGALIFADAFRIDGSIVAVLDRSAVLDGARAMATLLYIAPDARDRLAQIRAILADLQARAGATFVNGVLVVRALARDAYDLQHIIASMSEHLSSRRLPRVWQC